MATHLVQKVLAGAVQPRIVHLHGEVCILPLIVHLSKLTICGLAVVVVVVAVDAVVVVVVVVVVMAVVVVVVVVE